ncbi:uncharacterized protein BT62DRAFT_50419 [Guyanagaster necrorhizus]|uniref:Cyclase n=1 Tax=Guyanagaster necrorhizus TaxID=856835 RepID=A0A9P7W5X8_9AGAR|nr:uncharacterized protein BT62DRAFT_50419 [Guyanagaster necrorhizus MCA 3950]KAG7453189.1 hypothetical protein BT62DRAFT_50419 [Guyanagaster necrorhizus MCA 3950]
MLSAEGSDLMLRIDSANVGGLCLLVHFLRNTSTTMTNPSPNNRLQQILTYVAPREMNTASHEALPTFDELPMFKDHKGCAWQVWGPDDQLGTINLLTAEVVKTAASEEIKTGQTVSLNWPLNFPSKPMFHRRSPELLVIDNFDRATRDDEIHINSQSGTQWDGMRNSIPGGSICVPDPNNINPSYKHLGIQNWANHGICGRGVLLDLVRYYTSGGNTLPYDPWASHPITVKELEACAAKQGVKFRTGDILILHVGFIKKFSEVTQEERDALATKPETFAGIEQSDDMKRFLWNNHFAAVASDQPALERWPTPEGIPHMHQTLLALWGMPIGEMFDLERLSEICSTTGRYTFFFSSWPLNIIGGCASPPNAAAFF